MKKPKEPIQACYWEGMIEIDLSPGLRASIGVVYGADRYIDENEADELHERIRAAIEKEFRPTDDH